MKDLPELLDKVTLLALQNNFEELESTLDINQATLAFSESCVGQTMRKGSMMIRGKEEKITNFAHMCRVAAMVKHYFPDDTFSRYLAAVHDTKEEAIPGKEDEWKNIDTVANMPGLADAVDILTEIKPTEEEIEATRKTLPEEFDAKYIAEYRKFISRLAEHWDSIGSMELCDRLDGTGSFDYLMIPKYEHRIRNKSLETFGRIWATLSLTQESIVSEEIRNRCRAWFDRFGVNEQEVEKVALYFN